jgi:SAM-dependent methyltransferase
VKGPRRSLLRILLLSAEVLFLEMLLIRWIGTEVRVFAYLQNGVLVAAFLGLGLGARQARTPARILPASLALVLLALFIRDPFRWDLGEALIHGLTAFQDSMVWAVAGWHDLSQAVRSALVAFATGATMAMLWAIVVVFRPLGQWLGRWMDEEPRPILAYTANVLGSIVGIALFTALTSLRTPPWLWLVAGALGLVILVPLAEDSRVGRFLAGVLVLAVPVAAYTAPSDDAMQTVWSPYQKLVLHPWVQKHPDGTSLDCGREILVNGVFHQGLVDLDPRRQAADPVRFPRAEIPMSHYLLPYLLLPPPHRVLVAGAGTGNDVAAALRAGAEEVVALEIDPAIADWGREEHPNRPYSSPRVRVRVGDARTYFRRAAPGSFDVAWLGFLDSHTNPSAYTNIRLDHFVYTRESFEEIRRLLKPDGTVVLYFWSEAGWVGDRLARLLRDTFEVEPVSLLVPASSGCLGHGGLLLVGGGPAALDGVRRRMESNPSIRALAVPWQWPLKTPVTTDDWPYLYLPYPTVPTYHLIVAAGCLILGFALRRRMFRPGEPVDGPMLLLGAGFMLLEVAGVSRAALLYGTTWTVNAYVVGALLCMVLIANLVAARWHVRPEGWPFVGLFTTLLAVALVPTGWLAALPDLARVLVGAAFLTLPVFFSGLVFIGLWARSERRDLAFGSNILGSLLGGLASMLSMLIGFRNLMFVALALYVAVLLVVRGLPRAAVGGASPRA